MCGRCWFFVFAPMFKRGEYLRKHVISRIVEQVCSRIFVFVYPNLRWTSNEKGSNFKFQIQIWSTWESINEHPVALLKHTTLNSHLLHEIWNKHNKWLNMKICFTISLHYAHAYKLYLWNWQHTRLLMKRHNVINLLVKVTKIWRCGINEIPLYYMAHLALC